MFVCNFKFNRKLAIKLAIVFFIIILCVVFGVVGVRFHNTASAFRVKDEIPSDYLEINSNNYADILKDSHENIDEYVGKKVKFVGFVYRLYDFNENQFVLAREMIISSDNHAVVVGFLCNCENAKNFEDDCWVEAEGVIEKGNYHGDLPVIKITNLNKTSVPDDEYVFPPSV
jgi:uncharacterized repeat protein (TIGR03943 family)